MRRRSAALGQKLNDNMLPLQGPNPDFSPEKSGLESKTALDARQRRERETVQMICLDPQSVHPENPTLIVSWKDFRKGRFCHSPLFRRTDGVAIRPVWSHAAGRVHTPVRKAG